MTHMRRFIITALGTVIFFTGVSLAAMPKTINYQGYLTTNQVPVSGQLGITFSIYSSNPSRGNPVWKETHPPVQVNNGIYSVLLGSQKEITAAFDVPYWLGVKIEKDPEMSLQPLVSVPYSRRSEVAESVVNGPRVATNLSGNVIEIGTSCTNYMSVSISIPGPGTVIVDATNWISLSHTSGTRDYAQIYIGGTQSDCNDNYGAWVYTTPASNASDSFIYRTATPRRDFTVTTPGTYTYFLNGIKSNGTIDNYYFEFARMIATFYPN